MSKTIGKAGLELIKSFESLKLTAYKAVFSEKYYTIGWGHYGSDVKKGQVITKEKADQLLKKDLAKAEKAVNDFDSIYHWNQNEFDALVSFAYNVGNISCLTNRGKRSRDEIREKFLVYNKSGGHILAGLVKRRKKELDLFNTPVKSSSTTSTKAVSYYKKYTGNSDSVIEALTAIGVKDVTLSHRAKIAVKNNVCSKESDYRGFAEQNSKILHLLKNGKLIKA